MSNPVGPEPPTTTDPPLSRCLWLIAGCIALLAVGLRLSLLLRTGSTAEDFLITLRYAENLATGNGLLYNIGEQVLGTTTPLYAALLALLHATGFNPAESGKLLCIFSDGFSCLLLFRIACRVGWPTAGLFAAAMLAVSAPNLTWAVSGMETSLVVLLSLLVFACLIDRRSVPLGCLCGLAPILRIDGLVLAAVCLGAHSLVMRRVEWRSFAAFSCVFVPWAAYATLTYGSFIPSSAVAKWTVYGYLAQSPFPNLAAFGAQLTRGAAYKLALAAACAGAVVVARHVRNLRPMLLWMLLGFAQLAFSKVFLFGWYFVPPFVVYYLLVGLGVESVALRLTAGHPRRLLAASLVAVVVVISYGAARFPLVLRETEAAQESEERLRKPVGLALRTLVAPGERLMLEPIGYIGYYSHARILDAVGLVSPEVLRHYRRGGQHPYLGMMASLHPEWVLLRAGEYADVRQSSGAESVLSRYALVRTFSSVGAPAASSPAFYLLRRSP